MGELDIFQYFPGVELYSLRILACCFVADIEQNVIEIYEYKFLSVDDVI